MHKHLILILILTSLITTESLSQKKRGRLRDFFSFKNKKVEQPGSDEVEIQFDEGFFELDTAYLDSLSAWEAINLYKERSIVEEDTTLIPLHFNVPIQVSEQLFIDSVWVTLREYYSIWSSRKVNPYDLDGQKFTDSVSVPLHFEKQDLSWSVPIPQGYETSPFGLRRWRWHYGTDLRLRIGDSVRVAFDGIVRIAQYDRYGYGHYLLVRHYNGLETLYGHLKKRLALVGDEVKAGDVIGLGGNTGRSSGPHLHFEVRFQGNAIDPTEVFDFENDSLLSDTLRITPATFAYLAEARKIRYHRIRRGDTLGHISYRYGVPIRKICRLNGISRNTILRIGRRLRIN